MSDCQQCDILYDALRMALDAIEDFEANGHPGVSVLTKAQETYIGGLLNDDQPSQELWAKLANEFGLETYLNPKLRDAMKRLATIFGYDRCKLAFTKAQAACGAGPGMIAYAEKVLGSEAGHAAIDAQKRAKAAVEPKMRIDN